MNRYGHMTPYTIELVSSPVFSKLLSQARLGVIEGLITLATPGTLRQQLRRNKWWDPHIFMNIIPYNFVARTRREVWCDRGMICLVMCKETCLILITFLDRTPILKR